MGKAYFNDISLKIQGILESTENEVRIAVAWFTSHFLYRIVENLVEANKKATIIISDSPHNFGKLPFGKLVNHGAEVFVCPSHKDRFMHHKFAIVDNKRILSGSYNWSMSAENNWENIVEMENTTLILQFSILYNKLLRASIPFGDPIPARPVYISPEEKEDSALFELEKRFEQNVEASIQEALRIGVPIQTDNLYRFLDRYGAVGAANILASSEEGTNLQPGFKKMARRHRLDLTFEGQIVREEFRPLFSEKVIQFAEKKLALGKIEGQLPPDS